jgi:flavin-dependent dehydrogenase
MKRDRSFDAVVLGAGPAGCAVALALAGAGLRAAIVGRPSSFASRVGEALPPDVTPLLNRLGVWERFERDGHLPSPGIVSLWRDEEPYENSFLFNPYRIGWHLDRGRFDTMLAEVAEERGVVVFRGTNLRTYFRNSANGWQVGARSEGQPICLIADFLIDATGRTSWLTRRLGARQLIFDRLVGIVGVFKTGAMWRDPRLLLEAAEQGWWYSAFLPNNRLVIAYMTDVDLLPAPPRDINGFWAALLRETVQTRRRLACEVPPTTLRTTTADSRCTDRVAGEKWLAVGDAAMAWDPLSSQGISNALQSGLAAAIAITEARSGRSGALAEYESDVAHSFGEYRRLHARYYNLVRRWPHSLFWKRRQIPPQSEGIADRPARTSGLERLEE